MMKEQDFDLYLARLKRAMGEEKSEEIKDEEEIETCLEKVENELQKVLNFSLTEQTIFENFITMILPFGLFNEPIKEGNVVLFRSNSERLTLVIKMLDVGYETEPDTLITSYLQEMRKSKQQTKVDISESCSIDAGELYYFTAIHSMPERNQCDFIIIIKMKENMVIMDFNFYEEEYLLWKTVIQSLLPTIKIRKEGEYK